jgi:hypothetical protein
MHSSGHHGRRLLEFQHAHGLASHPQSNGHHPDELIRAEDRGREFTPGPISQAQAEANRVAHRRIRSLVETLRASEEQAIRRNRRRRILLGAIAAAYILFIAFQVAHLVTLERWWGLRP